MRACACARARIRMRACVYTCVRERMFHVKQKTLPPKLMSSSVQQTPIMKTTLQLNHFQVTTFRVLSILVKNEFCKILCGLHL